MATHWRAYVASVLTVVVIILAVAVGQHHFVLGIPIGEIRPPLLVIPAAVGAVFGFLLTTIRLMLRQQIAQTRQLEAQDARLRAEIAKRKAFAEREERLQFALAGANDRLWDWNIETGEVFYSVRWLEMLGYGPGELPGTLDSWRERLHPEDGPRVVDQLERHLRGEIPQYQTEFRIRTAHDDWKWVLGRGKVMERDATGRPLRASGTMTDISDRKRVEQALRGLLASTAGVVGERFFGGLVQAIAEVFEVPFVYLGLVDPGSRDQISSLALWEHRATETGMSFALAGTPYQATLERGTHVVSCDVGLAFPKDELLQRLEAEAYIGVALTNLHGQRIGVLALLDDRPLPEWKTQLAVAVLPLFAARATAEIERRRIEKALIDEKERAQVTLHSIADAVITTDADGRVQYMNPVAEAITGWSLAEALAQPISAICAPAEGMTYTPLSPGDDPARTLTPAAPGSMVLTSRDGREVAIEQTASAIADHNGQVIGSVIVFRDVTATLEMARQMSWQATHDALTGLVNRKEFERRLEALIEEARRGPDRHSLLYIDLDQFKVVNDTCGHIAGDELLRQLTLLLQGAVRQSDTLSRLGGDEFGLLLPSCDLGMGQRIAEKLIHTIQDFRFVWQDKIFDVGASIGLVEISKATEDATAVLSAADMACYAAKELGRNRIHVYEAGDEITARRQVEMQWAAQIKQAIEEDAFELYVQEVRPIGRSDGGHHEVLLRMRAQDGSLVLPGSFIPAAERYHVTPDIDRHVVQKLFADIHRHAPLQALTFAVNLSGKSLSDESLLPYILAQVGDCGIDPGHICFEITETSAIANLAAATRFMQTLRERGFLFALDDFGSGVSSFGYLKQLPVDYLKIDGSFVKDMASDPIDAAMVQAIHEIGHTIGIETIAEFVETEAILERLRQIGVDYAQGYHIHRPEPIGALTQRLGLRSQAP